jgi:hypothetical protein
MSASGNRAPPADAGYKATDTAAPLRHPRLGTVGPDTHLLRKPMLTPRAVSGTLFACADILAGPQADGCCMVFDGRITRGLGLLALVLAADPAHAEPLACPGGAVLTINAGDDAPLICAMAETVRAQLASCTLTVPAPITIAIVPDLIDHCLGIYHCGQGQIDLLPPARYAAMLESGEAEAFAPISPSYFFESVLRHEMAHAALDEMPCPFDTCIVGQEYIAYTMQIRFLPDADRAAFEAADRVEGRVSRDILNPFILMMAPEVFAHRAWQHLTERPDPCAFIGQVARAEVLLDYEHR